LIEQPSVGGTRQGMCISWPGHIKDLGGVRWQFHHMIDVVPTIHKVCGIPAPDYVDGIRQAPIESVSFAYTSDKQNANLPSRHKTQYFEMMGDHAIYHDSRERFPGIVDSGVGRSNAG
jgi:arylsulfatase